MSPINLGRQQLLRAAGNGFVQWVGEAFVGLIPLAAYSVAHWVSKPVYLTALCSQAVTQQYAQFAPNCVQLADNPHQEICILAVVISGLSVLSIAQFAPGRRRSPRTAFTYLMMMFSILALAFGALFYALITVHLDKDIAPWSITVLGVALASSFFLAMQEAFANERALRNR
jgi:hypothetical protein